MSDSNAYTSYQGFSKGMIAARKGRQCLIQKIIFDVVPPAVTVVMKDNGCEVGTEFDRLQKISSWCCSFCTAPNKNELLKCNFCGMSRNFKEKVTVEDPQGQQQAQQQIGECEEPGDPAPPQSGETVEETAVSEASDSDSSNETPEASSPDQQHQNDVNDNSGDDNHNGSTEEGDEEEDEEDEEEETGVDTESQSLAEPLAKPYVTPQHKQRPRPQPHASTRKARRGPPASHGQWAEAHHRMADPFSAFEPRLQTQPQRQRRRRAPARSPWAQQPRRPSGYSQFPSFGWPSSSSPFSSSYSSRPRSVFGGFRGFDGW